MIEERDVDTLIRAKRDQVVINILMIVAFLTFTILIALEALSIEHQFTILLSTLGMVFLAVAMGQNKWVSVSRAQLIDIIERIINNDANALKIIAKKNNVRVSAKNT